MGDVIRRRQQDLKCAVQSAPFHSTHVTTSSFEIFEFPFSFFKSSSNSSNTSATCRLLRATNYRRISISIQHLRSTFSCPSTRPIPQILVGNRRCDRIFAGPAKSGATSKTFSRCGCPSRPARCHSDLMILMIATGEQMCPPCPFIAAGFRP